MILPIFFVFNKKNIKYMKEQTKLDFKLYHANQVNKK